MTHDHEYSHKSTDIAKFQLSTFIKAHSQQQKQQSKAAKEIKNLEGSNVTTNLLLNMSSGQGNTKSNDSECVRSLTI